MTSKEALNHIVNGDYNEMILTYPSILAYDGMTQKDMVKLIERDLEVLEIIKTYAYEINFTIDNEDTKKVERWLFERDLEVLEEYKRIEEELGINLATLLKTEKIYWRIKWINESGYSEVKESYKCHIDLHNHQLIVYSNEYDEFGYPLPFENYGKTWALTREELENEQL